MKVKVKGRRNGGENSPFTSYQVNVRGKNTCHGTNRSVELKLKANSRKLLLGSFKVLCKPLGCSQLMDIGAGSSAGRSSICTVIS